MAYERILEKYKESTILDSIWKVMSWDTYTALPSGAVSQRAEQNAVFGKFITRLITDEEMGRLLNEIGQRDAYTSLGKLEQRNVDLIKETYDLWTQLPEELRGRRFKQRTITNNARERALAKNDWSIFEPELKVMFSVMQEMSEHLMEVTGVTTHYDVQVDWFQRGIRADQYVKIFDELKKKLPQMIEKYAEVSGSVRADFLARKVAKSKQKEMIEALAKYVGYDIHSDNAIGILGESVHPMSIGSYDDVRISVNYKEENFFEACQAFIHEAGHAIYEINLNRDWKYQPIGEPNGFGVHESQSKFMENVIGRSPEFIEYFLPIVNRITDNQFADVSVDEFVQAINRVNPGPIRVTSDELTFLLHIIVRFEIEKDLFEGKLEISEIPLIWKDLYEKYLRVSVKSDAEGVLQDLHWGVGQFGHFPVYALGNIFAAQLSETMEKEIPDWKSGVRKGNISNIIEWMSVNVHRKGSLYDAPEWIEQVTGQKMSSKPFINYLDKKYSEIYG
jgi:carboxypeptidase Taq